MKTAISISDSLFTMAELLAKQMKISRSELYARALAEFIKAHQDELITERLNEIYASEDSSVDPVLWQMQILALPKEEW
ncbi:MAG: hypothetical protein U0350_29320 [Caldilineaceae bacterium]